METLNFTVDAALLRELGERLVGKPYIALAELVKNSYDADASDVTIELVPEEDRIGVHDNGHGMNFGEFRDFWMRIGTPHKAEKRMSKYLKRPMTGSKGVGRLAVQLLADQLTMRTVARENGHQWLEASVDWTEAVEASELTRASATYKRKSSRPPFKRGTSIILRRLKHTWDAEAIEELARELWYLQPPFRSPSARPDEKSRFSIHFVSTQPEFEAIFEQQMRAILGIWNARLVGKNEKGNVTVSLEFAGEAPEVHEYAISEFSHNAGRFRREENLNDGDFEVRIFHLQYRQPRGIKVGEARQYLRNYGGVHVYDGGFRLPYYGDPTNDWLRILTDHAHRLSKSKLLPDELRVPEGMTFLPPLERVFAVVNVDTSREPGLAIMITRDRLAESRVAFDDLRTMVRYAMDLYAQEEARRKFERDRLAKPIEATSERFERVEQILAHYEGEIPQHVYADLRRQVQQATITAATHEQRALAAMGLLGPLATAGISALAYQHELSRQFGSVESITGRLSAVTTADPELRRSLSALAQDLSAWLQRARATNALFSYMADAENIETRRRFRARQVVDDVKQQTEFLSRGIVVDTASVDDQLLLPEASLVEWGAIFQNVFTNAFNAMLDSERRQVRVSSHARGTTREILVQDTGQGIDLEDADRLFEPFVRELELSPERRELGYGGTGLGLTIVRLLAGNIGCTAKFVKPREGFSTAFSLSWREAQ